MALVGDDLDEALGSGETGNHLKRQISQVHDESTQSPTTPPPTKKQRKLENTETPRYVGQQCHHLK